MLFINSISSAESNINFEGLAGYELEELVNHNNDGEHSSLLFDHDLLIGSSQNKNDNPQSFHYYVFLSLGIEPQVLKNIIRWHCKDAEVTLVWRGLLLSSGEKLSDGLLKIQRLITDNCHEGVNSIVDPRLFKKFGVDAVPTLVKADSYENLFAKKEGVYAQSLLAEDLVNKKGKELNEQDSYFLANPLMYKIIEPSITAQLKNAASNINWERKRRQIIADLWKKLPSINLEHALYYSTRLVSLSYKLKHNLLDHKGKIIMAKGTDINPLMQKNFDLKVVVFNPSIVREWQSIQRYLKEKSSLKKSDQLMFLVTSLNKVCVDSSSIFANNKSLNTQNIIPNINLSTNIADLNNLSAKNTSAPKDSISALTDLTMDFSPFAEGNTVCSSEPIKNYDFLVEQLGSVFLLDHKIVTRFKLKATPSVVSSYPQDPQRFVLITELGDK